MQQKKAIILLSGGVDSTTCLAYAKQQGYECYTIGYDYGQKHSVELEIAKKISQNFGARQHEIVTLSIGNLGGSALTQANIDVPDYQLHPHIPVTYVPARNTIFLSVALGWAEILAAQAIFIGVSAVDYSSYPDCRPEYIKLFQEMANLATKTAIEGNTISIIAPLTHLSKAETITLGVSLGVDYAMTVSCYRATHDGLACGKCDSCYYRKKGFYEAGIPDPTRYLC